MVETSESYLFRLLRRNVVEVLTLAYLAMLAYITLLPFDFSREAALNEPAKACFGLTVVAPNWPDLAGNVALYVPLGMLFSASLVKRRLSRCVAIVLAVLLAGAMSYSTEYSQRFSPSRVCSLVDFFANVAGAICGGVVAPVGLWLADRVAFTTHRDLKECPTAVLARVAAVALILTAWIPFDVAVKADRLANAIENPILVPFDEYRQAFAQVEDAAARGAESEYYAACRDWWALRLDYAGQVCGYALLAILTMTYLRRDCRMSVIGAAVCCVAACALLAIAAGTLRILLLSRGFDATYMVVGLGGTCAGVLTYGPTVRAWDSMKRAKGRPRRRLMLATVTLLIAFIVLHETAPFMPVSTIDSIGDQMASADRVPMISYFHARLPLATDDCLRKCVRFAILGLAITLFRAASAEPRSARPWRTGLVVAAWIVLLEGVQLLLPSRVPSVTDVLIALFATAAGVQAYRLAMAYYRDVTRPRQRREVTRIRYDVELGPPEGGPPERVPERVPESVPERVPERPARERVRQDA
jgi:VanZ family protein